MVSKNGAQFNMLVTCCALPSLLFPPQLTVFISTVTREITHEPHSQTLASPQPPLGLLWWQLVEPLCLRLAQEGLVVVLWRVYSHHVLCNTLWVLRWGGGDREGSIIIISAWSTVCRYQLITTEVYTADRGGGRVVG